MHSLRAARAAARPWRADGRFGSFVAGPHARANRQASGRRSPRGTGPSLALPVPSDGAGHGRARIEPGRHAAGAGLSRCAGARVELRCVHGMQRFFSLSALMDLGKVAMIATLLAIVGAYTIAGHIGEFAALSLQSLPAAVSSLSSILLAAFTLLAGTLAVTA